VNPTPQDPRKVSTLVMHHLPVIVILSYVLAFPRLARRTPSLHTLMISIVGDWCLPVLDEADVRAFFAEALTADVEAVLSDQTGAVGANATGTGSLAVGPRT